jgi:hypothetical protein
LQRPPDYARAQRIDDVLSLLALVMNEKSYCDFKRSEVSRLHDKLTHARERLREAVDARAIAECDYHDSVAWAVASLQDEHNAELQEHDLCYAGELPTKYRHFSQESQVIRAQEWALRETKQYTAAQAMMEEAEALEAFELEQAKIKWQHDGMMIRDAILKKHEKQMNCLREKLEVQYLARRPEFVAEEEHWRAVVGHLEALHKNEKVDRAQVRKETARIINREEGLPKLGTKVPPTPMTRVATVNNRLAYSNLAMRRGRGKR